MRVSTRLDTTCLHPLLTSRHHNYCAAIPFGTFKLREFCRNAAFALWRPLSITRLFTFLFDIGQDLRAVFFCGIRPLRFLNAHFGHAECGYSKDDASEDFSGSQWERIGFMNNECAAS